MSETGTYDHTTIGLPPVVQRPCSATMCDVCGANVTHEKGSP